MSLGSLLCFTGCGNFFVPENGGGGGGGGGTTGGNFVYAANSLTKEIAGFAVGTNTLTTVPNSPVGVGYVPLAAVVTPSNNLLYVAGPDAIYAYTIGSDGSLAAVGGGAAVAAISVTSLDVSPDGQWLFGLDRLSTAVDQYQINSSTGALTGVQATPYAVGNGVTVSPQMVKVSPKGNYVLIALGTGGDIVFNFNTSSGALANPQTLPPVSNSTSDNALAIDSAEAYLYIARSGTNGGIGVYTIGGGGVLNPISGSPFTAGTMPISLAFDSTGKYLYAANRGDGTISGYAIGSGSALTALTGSPYASGSQVLSLALSKGGTYLLAGASNGNNDLSMYSFDTTTPGKLNLAKGIATGTDPTGVTAIAATH